nr:hypothetical protein GCM10020092_103210 [Actinoplanes digitatis]
MLAPARAAGVLGADPRLVFRHRIVARVLHEGTPTALRLMLHRSFAEKVAAAGGAPELVVAQLLAGPVPPGPWAEPVAGLATSSSCGPARRSRRSRCCSAPARNTPWITTPASS